MLAAGLIAMSMSLVAAAGSQWTRVDVRSSVRVDDVDVTFGGHTHATAMVGRNLGMFSFDLSRAGGAKKSVRLKGTFDDLLAEIDVDGTLVVFRKQAYGTFDVRAVSPAPKPLEAEACHELLVAEVIRRGLVEVKDGTRSFTEADGVVTMHNPDFYSGSFARDEGVETDILANTMTRIGDSYVTFRGASPKHSDGSGSEKTVTLVYEVDVERDGETSSIMFTYELGHEHWSEREVLGQTIGLRATKGDELHVRLIHKRAREPLSMDACAARVAEEAKKTKRKVLAPESTSTRDGVVTVKTTSWTARCGVHSGRVTFH